MLFVVRCRWSSFVLFDVCLMYVSVDACGLLLCVVWFVVGVI